MEVWNIRGRASDGNQVKSSKSKLNLPDNTGQFCSYIHRSYAVCEVNKNELLLALSGAVSLDSPLYYKLQY